MKNLQLDPTKHGNKSLTLTVGSVGARVAAADAQSVIDQLNAGDAWIVVTEGTFVQAKNINRLQVEAA